MENPEARRTAFVTGASYGIGAAIALGLARAGYDIAISATRIENLAPVIAKLEGSGARVAPVALDLRSQESIETAMAMAIKSFGKVDVLVNNAGVSLRKSALEVTLAEWDAVIQVNVTGTFFISQQVGRHLMVGERAGSIISIASAHGIVGAAGRSTYGISKAAIILQRIMAGLATLTLFGTSAAAIAAAYPDKPVRLVVPSPPGGGTDASSRMIVPRLSELLGQQIIVDNRGGASGNIGAELVARAAPDGYTLLATIASHTINPSLMKKVPYDLERDFAPISLTVTLPNVLISHPALPVKTVRELITFAKARPGQLQYASAGVGSMPHLMMELFLNTAGVKMIHVPYKGAGPAFVDVMAGHLPLMAGNILSALPHIRSGRVRAYGVTSAQRSAAAPDIPTIAEAGVPGYEAVQWFGLLAPAGTPREIVVRLHGAVVQVLQDPAVRKRFSDDGAQPTPSRSPEDFAAFMRAETAKWARVVRNTGIQPE